MSTFPAVYLETADRLAGLYRQHLADTGQSTDAERRLDLLRQLQTWQEENGQNLSIRPLTERMDAIEQERQLPEAGRRRAFSL